MKRPQSILFVCGRNALRSPMAEGYVKEIFGADVYVDSVGIIEGSLDPMAVEVMAEIGIDISNHVPKTLDRLLDTSFDLVVVLSRAAEKAVSGKMRMEAVEIVQWLVGDPSDQEGNRNMRLHAFRETRDKIIGHIDALFSETDLPGTAGD